MKREVIFGPAWDKRNPNLSENYGIHGVEIRFMLIGDKGAVRFVIYTNWHLPHVQKEFDDKYVDAIFYKPLPADVGYHSPKPMYEGQEVMADSCEYLGGKPCYYDGSGLRAQEYFITLVTEGGEAMWRKLEEYYHCLFDEGEEI